MTWQTIIASLLGLGAFFYVGFTFIRQFTQVDSDQHCKDCPVNEDRPIT